MENINDALESAKKPGKIVCPICNEELFSPMDKFSIYLFGKCCSHIEENSIEEKNLFRISEAL